MSSDWTVTHIGLETHPTPLGPGPSNCRTAATMTSRPERQSSAMPDSATLPPSRSAGNSISLTQPLHGFSRSSLASIRREKGGGGADDMLRSSESMSSISTGTSKRIHALDEQARNRTGSSNVMEEMENARKTVRRAQAMGWIKTMPFSVSTPSASSHSDSSFFSSVSTSRNGSIAAGEEQGLGVRRTEHEDEDMATPKPGSSSRMMAAIPAAVPHTQRLQRQNTFESSPYLRKTSSGSTYSAGASGIYDGGMVASTGWLITVVPPDSLYYALNGEHAESLDVPPDASAKPHVSNSGDSTAEGLDKVLAAARLKKWRKGKILPLVSDLKGMMRAIGREWNLPSEVGMEVYLSSGTTKAHDRGPPQRSDPDEDEMEEMDGMLSEETWRMVWGEYVFEEERKRMRTTSGKHTVQPETTTSTVLDVEQGKFTKDDPSESAHLDSQEGISPTSAEPPLTGNTFGTSQPSSDSSHGSSPAPNVIIPHESPSASLEHARQPLTEQAVAYHANALTPESSQTSFGLGSAPPKDILMSAAQAMLSPSPSSVFPGASSSQQASPMSARRSTSGTTQRRVLGRIEFDFDSSPGSRGEWYAKWLKRKLQSRQGWADESASKGIRPLRLATQDSHSAKSDTSEYVEDLDEEEQAEYAPLMDEDEDHAVGEQTASPRSLSESLASETEEPVDPEIDRMVSGALAEAFPEGSDDFVNAFTAGRSIPADQPTYSWRDIGSQRILDDDVKLDQLGPLSAPEEDDMDVAEIQQMLRTEDAKAENQQQLVPANIGQLLASPIDLASPQVDTNMQPSLLAAYSAPSIGEPSADGNATVHGLGMGIDMDEEGKRGSALVISSQLDILERALRDLSPRDIRFSIYPGLPGPSTFQEDVPTREVAAEDIATSLMASHASQRFSDASKESETTTTHSQDYSVVPLTAEIKTPALGFEPMFARTPDTYAPYPRFTPRSAPDGASPMPLSLETMSRMEYDAPFGGSMSELPKKSPGWKPQRPARPPSPHLEQYTAPSPHLKLSDTPPPATRTVIDTRGLSKSPEEPVLERPRVPSGSKGMNKLNRLFNRRVSEKSVDESRVEGVAQSVPVETPDQGLASKSPKPNDSFGRRLFKGLHVKSPSTNDAFATAVISDPVVVSTTNKQAYQLSQLQKQQSSPPAPPIPNTVSSSGPRGIPSSPSLDILHTAKTSQHPFGTPTIPTSPSLNTIFSASGQASSPSSPSMSGGAAVRRKPVPRREGDDALPTSQSVRSITSFVLEDAPKRTKKTG